jgi:DNA polymerase-3 subunit epsilon
MREIVLDTETTGLDPASGHRVIEIGCVEVISGVRSGEFFHCYLNPQRDVPDEAFRVHGLSTEFLADKPIFAEKVDDFLAFIGDSPLVIHNAGFDMRFINAELQLLGFAPLPSERALDTVAMARKKFPGSPASLDALCKRFEIDLSARTKHGALLDAELLAEVYLELLGGRQVKLALEVDYTSPAQGDAIVLAVPPMLESRMFPPTQEELEAHARMLAQLKKPVWEEA